MKMKMMMMTLKGVLMMIVLWVLRALKIWILEKPFFLNLAKKLYDFLQCLLILKVTEVA